MASRLDAKRQGHGYWRPAGVLVVLVVFLCGCHGLDDGGLTPLFSSLNPGGQGDARVSLFLRLNDSSGPPLRIGVSAIEFQRDGEWFGLGGAAVELDAEAIGDDQIFLSRNTLLPGQYDAIRLRLEQASVRQGKENLFIALASPDVVWPLSSPLRLEKGDSVCLFLIWDTARSMQGKALIAPFFTVVTQGLPLLADLAYVACPEIDTVYTIRTDKNWITGALGVVGCPTYLAADVERNRLFVLARKEAAVKVVELSSNRLVDTFRLPMVRDPSFMTLSADRLTAYILDGQGSHLVRMDLTSGSIVGRLHLGERAHYLLYLPEYNRLAVSLSYSQEVILLDPVSLETVEHISVGGEPQGLCNTDNFLYIAENGSDTVMAYDLASHRQASRVHVGRQPRRLFGVGNRLYVANYGSGSVSLHLARQAGMLKDVFIQGVPLEMAAAQRSRRLYIGNEASGEIAVLDLTSGRINDHIVLKTVPQGLTVIQ